MQTGPSPVHPAGGLTASHCSRNTWGFSSLFPWEPPLQSAFPEGMDAPGAHSGMVSPLQCHPCLIPSLALPGSCGIHLLSLVTTAAWFSWEKSSFLLVHVAFLNSPASQDAAAQREGKQLGMSLELQILVCPVPDRQLLLLNFLGLGCVEIIMEARRAGVLNVQGASC